MENIIQKKPKFVEYRQINDENIAQLKNYLSNNKIFDSIYNSEKDVNENYNEFLKILNEARDKFLPLVKRRFNKYKDKIEPWMTNGILKSIRTRDKLHRKLILECASSSIYPYIEAQLRFHRYILRRLITQAKQSYWEKQFSSVQNDIKQTWRLIHKAVKSKSPPQFPDNFNIGGRQVTNMTEIANEFNKFFVNIGENLASQINPMGKTFNDYLKKDFTDNNFHFEQISILEIDKVINQLPNKHSNGYDGFNMSLIKKIRIEINEPLVFLFNHTIRTGIFPDSLKTARVIPIYKKGDENLLDNYRPISILPAFSKIYERILFNQLIQYFNHHDILFNSQYGFRSGHSTENAALELVERILTSFSKNSQSLALFLDLSKAFDSLDHRILLDKLKYYGLSAEALQLITSYFENRHQFIDINGTYSTYECIRTGVPQGSVLGPLFFIIYINDLNDASDIFDLIMFADDSTLHCSLPNNYTISNQVLINTELNKIHSWLCANKLTINTSKTKFIIFHQPNSIIPSLSLSINDKSIIKVSHFNFLGLTIDENLSWTKHISSISSKISSAIGMMRQSRNILPPRVLKLIYNSLITSRLNYMLTIWGGNFNKLLILQKKALRVIHRKKFNAHCDPLFISSNILKIHDQYKVNLLKFYSRIKNGSCPHYFKENKILLREDIHSHDTRYKKLIHKPLAKFNFLRRTFFYRIGDVINRFPINIISKLDTHSIKNVVYRTKSHLLDQYKSVCSGCYACK